MKTKLSWILLAASVAFNVTFIVGYLRVHGPGSRPKSFGDRMKLLGKRLDLDEQQWKEFNAIVAEQHKLLSQRSPGLDKVLAEMMKDDPDQEVIDEFLEGDTARAHRRERAMLIHKLMRMLRPEQREEFVNQIRARRNPSKR